MTDQDIRPPFRLTHVVEVVPSLTTQAGPGLWDSHPTWELILVHRGQHRIHQPNRDLWQGGPGAMILLPPHTAHRPDPPLDKSTAIFVVQWQGEGPSSTIWTLHDQDGHIMMLCRWLQSLPRPGEVQAERLHHHLLGLILAECQRLLTTAVTVVDPIERLHQEIRRLHHAALDYDQLAASVHMSPRHMARLFRQRYGCTPAQHLQHCRAQQALQLISSTDLPLQQIAHQVGLRSAAHLSRLIQRHTGRSVRSLRR